MIEWIRLLIIAALFVGIAATGKFIPRDAEYEVIEGDPCDTCLRWPERNGVDDECPIRRK